MAVAAEKKPEDVQTGGIAADRLRSSYSVAVASLTTLIAFGALATSGTAILQAIGQTVALGAVLSLVFSAAWARSTAA